MEWDLRISININITINDALTSPLILALALLTLAHHTQLLQITQPLGIAVTVTYLGFYVKFPKLTTTNTAFSTEGLWFWHLGTFIKGGSSSLPQIVAISVTHAPEHPWDRIA
ncbi:hypothetical protein E2C01_026585 [Portunus trituberculatus]|uniref:Uncharacterized protein n=1 Tax=Portunus trituberculatus TaxID=210409 RepID=A0A5B7EGH6_PORTR|nr:hypothetical protein [Portunus trituberculatus]